jgi:hypothetical protein
MERLGPFKGTDSNTCTTKTRGMAYFPFEVLGPLLGADLTARQAFFELVVPSLVDSGLEVFCAGLVNFLKWHCFIPPRRRMHHSRCTPKQASLATCLARWK